MRSHLRVIFVLLLLAEAVVGSRPAAAQEDFLETGRPATGWQVMRADYGVWSRRVDVTARVRRLLAGNGPVVVNNGNLGGEPAPGADKVLRINARNSRGAVRQFVYKEGATIDASQFYGYGGGPGPGGPGRPPGNPGYPGGGYPGGGPGPGKPGIPGGLQIVRAYYGANKRTTDVTGVLRSMVRGNSLTVRVNNANLGPDPTVGADKVLTVIYRFHGRENSVTVHEGNWLRIP